MVPWNINSVPSKFFFFLKKGEIVLWVESIALMDATIIYCPARHTQWPQSNISLIRHTMVIQVWYIYRNVYTHQLFGLHFQVVLISQGPDPHLVQETDNQSTSKTQPTEHGPCVDIMMQKLIYVPRSQEKARKVVVSEKFGSFQLYHYLPIKSRTSHTCLWSFASKRSSEHYQV